VIGGELYGGRSGGAGEIGHIPVDAPNYRRRCQCGRDTCLEACFGGAAISEHLAIRGQGSEGDADFAALAAARNPVAIEVLRDAGTHIGDAIGTLCNVFNPELVVIGGKLSQVEQLTHALRASLYARALPLNARDLEVVVSKNAADASILGAAWQVIDLVLSTELVNQDLADYAETFDSTSSSTRRIDWSTAPASTASSPSAEIRISGG
jgi:predicted NBD/HSP70 family sugar kinase